MLQQCVTIGQGLCHPQCDKDKTDSNLKHFSNVLQKQALKSSITAHTGKLLPNRNSLFTASKPAEPTREIPSAEEHRSILLIFPLLSSHTSQHQQVSFFSSPFLEPPLSQDLDFALAPTLPNAETAVFHLFFKKEKSYINCLLILQAMCILDP